MVRYIHEREPLLAKKPLELKDCKGFSLPEVPHAVHRKVHWSYEN